MSLYRYRMHGENRTNDLQELKKYDEALAHGQ